MGMWSYTRVTGYLCMLLGVLYVVAGVTYALTPVALAASVTSCFLRPVRPGGTSPFTQSWR